MRWYWWLYAKNYCTRSHQELAILSLTSRARFVSVKELDAACIFCACSTVAAEGQWHAGSLCPMYVQRKAIVVASRPRHPRLRHSFFKIKVETDAPHAQASGMAGCAVLGMPRYELGAWTATSSWGRIRSAAEADVALLASPRERATTQEEKLLFYAKRRFRCPCARYCPRPKRKVLRSHTICGLQMCGHWQLGSMAYRLSHAMGKTLLQQCRRVQPHDKNSVVSFVWRASRPDARLALTWWSYSTLPGTGTHYRAYVPGTFDFNEESRIVYTKREVAISWESYCPRARTRDSVSSCPLLGRPSRSPHHAVAALCG